MNKTVLAIIEPDTFPDEVAKRAAWIATNYDCDLELLLCDPVLTVFGNSFIGSTETQQLVDTIHLAHKEMIDHIAESVAAKNLKIEATILHESPISDGIVSRAMDSKPAFVVKGTAHHSPAERATFTYTDWRLIRKLDCPVWLVKPGKWKTNPVIVAAVDPTHQHDPDSTIDKKIVGAGKVLAAKTDGKLLLLHTYQRLVEVGSQAAKTFKPIKLQIDQLDKRIRDKHRLQLDALAEASEIPAKNVHQLPGQTRDILPAFVRSHGANVVVMGAIARTGLKRRIVGSTAEKVLDLLPCDILLVRND